MSLWFACELILGWFLAAIILAVVIGAALGWDENTEPLLCRWADRRDEQRMVALIERREREEEEQARSEFWSRLNSLAVERECERIWHLPTREPHHGA